MSKKEKKPTIQLYLRPDEARTAIFREVMESIGETEGCNGANGATFNHLLVEYIRMKPIVDQLTSYAIKELNKKP